MNPAVCPSRKAFVNGFIFAILTEGRKKKIAPPPEAVGISFKSGEQYGRNWMGGGGDPQSHNSLVLAAANQWADDYFRTDGRDEYRNGIRSVW